MTAVVCPRCAPRARAVTDTRPVADTAAAATAAAAAAGCRRRPPAHGGRSLAIPGRSPPPGRRLAGGGPRGLAHAPPTPHARRNGRRGRTPVLTRRARLATSGAVTPTGPPPPSRDHTTRAWGRVSQPPPVAGRWAGRGCWGSRKAHAHQREASLFEKVKGGGRPRPSGSDAPAAGSEHPLSRSIEGACQSVGSGGRGGTGPRVAELRHRPGGQRRRGPWPRLNPRGWRWPDGMGGAAALRTSPSRDRQMMLHAGGLELPCTTHAAVLHRMIRPRRK